MKILKRITALILTAAICFSMCSVNLTASAVEVNEPRNIKEYREIIERGAYPAVTTKLFVSVASTVNRIFRILTGRGFKEPEHFNFVADEILMELCGYVADETGLDLLLLLQSAPEANGFAELVTETFNIDPVVLREAFYEKRYEFDEQGNSPMAIICYFLGMYFSIIEECKVYCVPYEEWGEDWYEMHFCITMRDGAQEVTSTGVMVNPVTGEVCGKNDNGMGGLGYNVSVYDLLVYTPVKVWMRDFGFCLAYDLFVYSTPFFFYDTRRIKFDYEGKEWMIQVWKGNYLTSNGAEIGIYNRDAEKRGTYYDCVGDEDMMKMSFKLYHGDELIVERPETLHWWLTGFKLSNALYPDHSMTLDFTVEMKDEAMLEAFCKAVEKHYRRDMTYTVDGLKVNIIW